MDSEMTIMKKIDMPSLRIELRDESLLLVIEQKLERKPIKFMLAHSLYNMPSLLGFEVKPIFKK